VLCEPDNQELGEQAEAYEALTEAATLLALGRAIPWETTVPVSLIALDGHPIAGKANHLGDRLWIEATSEPTMDGMSGSPVLDQRGAAIGVFTRGQVSGGVDSGGSAAMLLAHLPGWLLVNLGAAGALSQSALNARNYSRSQMLKYALESGQIKPKNAP
jgi:hypothetical protein